jgi:hypothetical protein
MEELTIRRRVREMVRTGALPCEDPESLWGGMGDGARCAACAEPIGAREVEYEADLASGRKILLHRPCYLIWIEECEPGPSTPEAPAPSTP